MDFNAFVEDIKKNNWNVFGVEVYVDGKLSHSYGDTTDTRYPIYSATKTITSIAIGMAVDEGKVDINKSILEYLPPDVVNSMQEKQIEIYKKITTKDLLTMSVSGYPFRPEGESWLVNALNYPISLKGEFSYSNISAYLAGVVVSCAVGGDLYQYLKRKLFEPLGIYKPPYESCPDGYFIWKYRDGYSINGKWKQKCYVLPQEKLVITYLSHIEEDMPELKESMERNILK